MTLVFENDLSLPMVQKNTIKNRIKRIQSYMGVNADGVIGPATLTAVENRIFSENHDKSMEGFYSFALKTSQKRWLSNALI